MLLTKLFCGGHLLLGEEMKAHSPNSVGILISPSNFLLGIKCPEPLLKG